MIAEAFLTCALAVTPTWAFPKGLTDGAQRAWATMMGSREFVGYVHGTTGKILVVGGDPHIVWQFRDNGTKAFGALTSDRPAATKWHVVADQGWLPFFTEFDAVYWLEKNPLNANLRNELLDVANTIIHGGFFLYNPHEQFSWKDYLEGLGWSRMSFMTDNLHIWQKPYPGEETIYLGKGVYKKRLLMCSA